MKCDNCGKREVSVRYWENINGRKKELNLCEQCSNKLGINQMDFNMPIGFSSFFEGFIEDFSTPEFMPMFNEIKALKCDNCGYTFNDIANTGNVGCNKCYQVFGQRLDPIIKRIQGSNKHVGRIGKIVDKREKSDNNNQFESKNKNTSKVQKLQEELKNAIKDEKYEEAAKLRDQIKKQKEE